VSTFSEIQTDVLDTLIDNPAAVVSAVPGFINEVIQRAQSKHNFRFMEAEETFETVIGIRSLGVKPDLWKEANTDPVLAENKNTREIAWMPSKSQAIRDYNDDPDVDKGAPQAVLENETTFDVYPYPDGQSQDPGGEYTINLPYWDYLPPLVNDTDENWFTQNAKNYVVWAASGEGFLFLENETRAAIYLKRAGGSEDGPLTGELARIVSVDKRSRLSRRITLRPSTGVFGSNRIGRQRNGF
jgi:hypothetical protein